MVRMCKYFKHGNKDQVNSTVTIFMNYRLRRTLHKPSVQKTVSESIFQIDSPASLQNKISQKSISKQILTRIFNNSVVVKQLST